MGIPHLVLRGETFWFRMAVPRPLIRQLKIREIKSSLKTRDVLIAAHRARMLNQRFDALFSRGSCLASLTHETVRELARGYFQDCLNRSDELLSMMRDEGVDLSVEADYAASRLSQLKHEHQSANFAPVTSSEVEQILQQAGLPYEKVGHDLLKLLKAAVVRARIEDTRILLAKINGDFTGTAATDPWFLGMDVSDFPPIGRDHGIRPKPPRLGETIDTFHKSRRDRIARKTAENEYLVLSICAEVVGSELPLSAIGVDEVRAVRDAFQNLPVHHTKNSDLRDLSLKQLLALPS